MRKVLFSTILSLTAIAMPALKADDRPHKYYDRDAKDYHQWNGDEDRTWRQYQEEQHRQYRDFSRSKRQQQQEYWRWRHQHEQHEQHEEREHDRR